MHYNIATSQTTLRPTNHELQTVELTHMHFTHMLTISNAYLAGFEEAPDQGLARNFGFSNISLVITYVTVIVAALMLAGFLWMAYAYSGSGSGYGRKKREAFDYDEGISNTSSVRPILIVFDIGYRYITR